MKEKLANFLSLTGSLTTLVCWAFPVLLVSLGLGSVLAATVSNFPFLIALSRHKAELFLGAGVLLALNYYLVMVLPAKRRCEPGQACHIGSGVSKFQRALFWSSVAIYVLALVITYGGEYYVTHFA